MDKYELIDIEDKNIWERFILANKPHTFLQSWDWGEVAQSLGSKFFRLGFIKNKNLAGVCLVIKEEAKRGPHLLIPAGPVINWNDSNLVNFVIEKIKLLAKKENVWFVRIRAELEDTLEWREKFRQMGFVPSPMHVHAENTWILDISKSDEELLAGMRKSTRYLVRKSLNSGLSLTVSGDPEKAGLLFDLQKETAERHNFVGFSKARFAEEIRVFGRDGQAEVFICSFKGKPLAAAIIIFYGENAYYHYSGSVSEFSKLPFSYFLQWQIIKEAKKRNMKCYNFWGIAPNDNPGHRFAGVTLFKTGFGGKRLDWLHARDYPISPFYWLTFIFETIRHNVRKL